MRSLASAGSRVAILLIATVLLTGSATQSREKTFRTLAPPPIARDRLKPGAALAVPAALTEAGLGLRAGPVPVPLELRMPSIGVNAPMVGVGITATNVMDAPMGKADDPVWQQAFWYRGSAIPGALSTALIAGHIDGPGGSPAVFGHIDALQPGDPIVVHDTRNGLDVRFSVTDSKTYSLDETTDPAVLTQIYGAGPVAGTWSQPSADGLAHLTLITCAGTFRNGTHDHRLVVYATRIA
jgi:sortase (surface protein transpeptidase)